MAEIKKIDVIGNIYNNIIKGIGEGNKMIALQGSARCFAPDTKVRMYDGRLKCIQDIVIGDKIMNMQGNGYNTVVELHHGTDLMYVVKQPRGIDYIVNSSHNLAIKQVQAFFTHGVNKVRKPIPYNPEQIIDIPISHYLATTRNYKEKHAGFKNTLLQLEKKELPIDPYYLGVWIGDGTAARPHSITNSDSEIIDWFYDFAKELGTTVISKDDLTYNMIICENGTKNKRLNGRVREFFDKFKKLMLVNNKYIPEVYIYSAYEDRLKLLAGLLDTDGYKTKRGTLGIILKDKHIIEAIEEICRISGFYTNGIHSKIARMKKKDGSYYECEVYRIELNHNNFSDLNKYMKVKRKKIINKSCDRNYFTTKIHIEPIGIGEFYGFTLDNDTHFLLEDGTVVNNSGKTFNTIIFLIQACLTQKIIVSVVRLSMPSLKRSVFRDFIEIMCSMGIYNPRNMNKTEMVYTFQNGSTMEFFATADNEQKVRGSSRDILFVNEANELGEWEFNQLKMRTRKFSIVDFNPSFTEDHWLFKRINADGTYHFVSTFRDNPFLTDAIRDEIESYKYTNPALWQIFGEGKFAIVEGLVFPKATWDTCSFDDLPNGVKPARIGIDVGFSGKGDPTTAILTYFSVIDGIKHAWLQEIFYERGMSEKSVAYRLKQYNDIPKYIDSANPLYIQNIEDNGIQLLYPVKKYSNSVIDGITKMQGYKIHIFKTSTNLIKEFNNYCWMKDRHEQFTNTPIDKFNHCFVAGTKIMTINGEKNIEDICIGDLVLTRSGLRPVMLTFDNGMQDVYDYTIHTNDGDIKITSTDTHKIKSHIGWKQICELQSKDSIYLIKSLTEKCTTFTMGKNTIQDDVNDCISLYGNFTMVQFLKDFMCIILTEIELIIQLIICNWLNLKSISVTTRTKNITIKNITKNKLNFLIALETQLKNGIAAKRERFGIENMQKENLKIWKRRSMFVSVVENIFFIFQQVILNFAQTIVNRAIDACSDSITKSDIAHIAEKRSRQINTQKLYAAAKVVVSDTERVSAGKQRTYNLMIAGKHEYFANGLLVSNCVDAARYAFISDRSGRFGDKTIFNKKELGFSF